jgi:uncharacterized membrane protein
VNIFPWRKQAKHFFTSEDEEKIVQAIREAEVRTSGEVRVFIESRCRYVDPLDRAAELFFRLEMERTADRNGVLVYVAIRDRQLAVFGDENIHKRVGAEYWNAQVNKMLRSFNKKDYSEGLRQCVIEIGEALHQHFPYDRNTDKNELPDDIVFGR